MDAFEAIGEPTRRILIELLSEGERSAGELVSHFDISFSAVSQQLRLLSEAGIVTVRRQGRQRFYRLEPDGLDPLAAWTVKWIVPVCPESIMSASVPAKLVSVHCDGFVQAIC